MPEHGTECGFRHGSGIPSVRNGRDPVSSVMWSLASVLKRVVDGMWYQFPPFDTRADG